MHLIRLYFQIGLMLIGLAISQVALAHEVRPTIFTLKFQADRSFTLTADTSLEALIAGIGAEHEDTDDAPNADVYNQLRALPAGELESRFKDFAGRWIGEIGMEFDGARADMNVGSVQIPAVGDLDVARESIVQLTGKIPEGADKFQWAYPEKFGSSVLRVERPDQELQAQFGDREKSLRILANSIKEMEQTFQNDSAIMSSEQKKKAEDNIIQNKRRFQFEQQSLKEDLQARQRELLKKVQVSIKAVIQEFGEANGYDFIFTDASIAYASDAVNVTQQILDQLNQ